MRLFWVPPQHRQAPICRHFAKAHDFLLPEGIPYLVSVGMNGTIQGLSAVSNDPADPYILYMYVPEANRGCGIGDLMMKEIIESSSKNGISSLRCFTEPDMNMDSFLAKYGFEFFPGPSVYRTTFGALRYSRQYLKNINGKSAGKACPISQLGKDDMDVLKVFFDRKGLEWASGYDNSISTSEINEKAVDGLILSDRIPNGMVFKYIYSGDNKASSLLRCFRALSDLKYAGRDIPPGFILSFALDGDRNYQLIRNLVGDDAQISEPMETSIAVRLL